MEDIKLPDIINKVGFDFHWREEKVWKLKYPAEEMNIKELDWHFEIPFHRHGNEVYTLKSIDIIKKSLSLPRLKRRGLCGTFGCKKILVERNFLHRELLTTAILLCSRTPHSKECGFNVRDIKKSSIMISSRQQA